MAGAAGFHESIFNEIGAIKSWSIRSLSDVANCLDSAGPRRIVSNMANNLDAILAALSDPTRRAVVEQLTEGAAPVSDLYEPFDMALPTFLRHLKVLEASGLVRSEKKGRVRTVRMNAAPLKELDGWLEQHRAMWTTRLDRLEQLADKMNRTRS